MSLTTQLTVKRVFVAVAVLALLNWILLSFALRSMSPQQKAAFHDRQNLAEHLLLNPLFLLLDALMIFAATRWVRTDKDNPRRMMVVAMIFGNIAGLLLMLLLKYHRI